MADKEELNVEPGVSIELAVMSESEKRKADQRSPLNEKTRDTVGEGSVNKISKVDQCIPSTSHQSTLDNFKWLQTVNTLKTKTGEKKKNTSTKMTNRCVK